MSHLTFSFALSESSNDHQVRVLVDGTDILFDIEKSALGIDPVEFFAQSALRDSGTLLIGRCECGCVGCSDVCVSVRRTNDTVEWLTEHSWIRKLTFDSAGYDQSVNIGASEFGWETIERTAERLVSQLDFSTLAKDGLIFEWASGRIDKDKISLSFSREKKQKLVDAPWDHKDPLTAVAAVRELLLRWPQ